MEPSISGVIFFLLSPNICWSHQLEKLNHERQGYEPKVGICIISSRTTTMHNCHVKPWNTKPHYQLSCKRDDGWMLKVESSSQWDESQISLYETWCHTIKKVYFYVLWWGNF